MCSSRNLHHSLNVHTSQTAFWLTCLSSVGSEKNALQALKSSDWRLEAAFDVFYSQPQPRSNADTRRLEELYNRYKGKLLVTLEFIKATFNIICVTDCFNIVILYSADQYSDMILADGVSVLCNDIQVAYHFEYC